MADVKLVAVTQPRIQGVHSAQELVAYCARVSNPENQENHATAEKLLRYCVREAHWSVFEMVDVTVEVVCTRDIARQLLRHRSFSFQEFSQRYADAGQLGMKMREARLQDLKNRQKSSAEGVPAEVLELWGAVQLSVMRAATEGYRQALEAGVAKEVARAVLPEGLTLSRLYMKGSLRSWIHYCGVRRGNGTQKEHVEIADKVWELLVEEFPWLQDSVG